jgi:hypothetical protein
LDACVDHRARGADYVEDRDDIALIECVHFKPAANSAAMRPAGRRRRDFLAILPEVRALPQGFSRRAQGGRTMSR